MPISLEEMMAAPSWERTWAKSWSKRDKAQFDQPVYRCPRCTTKNTSRYAYGCEGTGFRALILECGHFIKTDQPMPVAI